MKFYIKKQIIFLIVICVCIFLLSSATYALSNELTHVTLFINDQETSLSVYDKDLYVPFLDFLSMTEYNISAEFSSVTIYDDEDNINIKLKIIDNRIYFQNNVSTFGYFINEIYYIELGWLKTLLNGEIIRRDNSIYFYTSGYYSRNISTSIPNVIRNLVDISVYVNNTLIKAPVYHKLETNFNIYRVDRYLTFDYVKLESILDVLNTQLKNKIRSELPEIEEKIYINDEVYIPFWKMRNLIGGSMRYADSFSIYLYSEDFIRTDIPSTLEECYTALDELLDETTKEELKSKEHSIALHHMGIGMWIRNNWIYPVDNRIAKVFYDQDIYHADDISYIILAGYQNYLNGLPYELYAPPTGDSLFTFFKIIVLIIVIIFICIKNLYHRV